MKKVLKTTIGDFEDLRKTGQEFSCKKVIREHIFSTQDK